MLGNEGSVRGSCALSPAQTAPLPWEGYVNRLPLFAAGTELLRMQIKISRG